jgi:hypothetical protein
MKAARNARFRLIPGNVRAQVVATARASGRTRVVDGPVVRPADAMRPSVSEPQQAVRVQLENRGGPYSPTEKQLAFYQRLAESPVFTEEERKRALEWLATKATRQTIKDQIDWLKRQVETRKPRAA